MSMSVFAPLFEPRRSARLLQPVKKGPVKKVQQSPRALRFLKRQQLQVQVEGGGMGTSGKRKKVLDDVADDDQLFQQPVAKRRKSRESDTPPPPPPPTERPQPVVVDVDINVDREQPMASSSKTTLEPTPTPTPPTPTTPTTTSTPLPLQFIIEKPFARSYHTAITFEKKDDDEMEVEADAEDDSESDDDDDDDEWLIPHSRKKTELDIWRFACRRRVDHITHQYTPSIIRDLVSQDARRHHTPRDEEDYLTEEIFDWELDSDSDSEDEPPLITFALPSPPASPLDPPQQLLPLPPPRLSSVTLPELVAQYGFAESTPPPTPSLCMRIGKGTPIDPARRAAWAQTPTHPPLQPPSHSPTPELDPRMWDEFLEKINREPFDPGMNAGVESFTNMLFEGETGF